MEDVSGGKPLTLEEKEKLKERLALLKKEYNRTYNRLRRSQRADRGKSHVQKTIEEHNHLLSQEDPIPCSPGTVGYLVRSTGPPNNVSNTIESAEKLQTRTDNARELSVKLNPAMCSSPKYTECENVCQKKDSAVNTEGSEKNIPLGNSRSRLKLHRVRKSSCSAENVLAASSMIYNKVAEIEGLEEKALTTNCSGSPVFKKSASRVHVDTHNGNITGSGACILGSGEKCAGNSNRGSDNQIAVISNVMDLNNISDKDSHINSSIEKKRQPLSIRNMGKTRETQQSLTTDKTINFQCQSMEQSQSSVIDKNTNTFTNETSEPLSLSRVNQVMGPPLSLEKTRKAWLSTGNEKTWEQPISHSKDSTKEPTLCFSVDKRELSHSKALDKIRDFPLPCMNQSNQCMQKKDAACELLATPPPKHISPEALNTLCCREQESSNSERDDKNPLSSCTLVEGLLFPVEYYVRTTRRMSSCQRKVNLDAVINSHLGTSRRGSRGKRSARLSRDQDSFLMSPFSKDCMASNTVSDSFSLTPLSHHAPNHSVRGANRRRRGRAPSCNLTEMPSFLETNLVTSPKPSGSQSEKENCEMRSTLSLQTNSLESSENESCLMNNPPLNIYTLRSRNTAKASSSSLRDKDDHENDLILNKKLKQGSGLKDKRMEQALQTPPSSDMFLDSPYQALTSKISLKQLNFCCDIKDFHLPDEDFGVLKLEKLKTARHEERFVPIQPTQNKTVSGYEQDKTTVPVTNDDAEGVATDLPNRDVFIVKTTSQTFGTENTVESCNLVSSPGCHVEMSKVSSQESINHEDNLDLPSLAVPKAKVVNDQTIHKNYLLSLHGSQERSNVDLICHCEDNDTVSCLGCPNKGDQLIKDQLSSVKTSPVTTLELKAHSQTPNKMSVGIQLKTNDSPVAKEQVSCSALFSSSMCSIPLDTGDRDIAPSTPGFPLLGLTPAISSMKTQDGGLFLPSCSPKDKKEMDNGGCSAGSVVDICSVQWQFPSGTLMCVVAAGESAVSLWRPLSAGQWEAAHSWTVGEIPVTCVLPFPGEKNIVCVALGSHEILQIWALFSCPNSLSWGIEKIIRSHTLQPPEFNIMAFSEVKGEPDSLVGSTVDNQVGLLFLILSSPHSSHEGGKERCAFRLIAANPKRAVCTNVMSYMLPEGQTGRY
ncbi:hypothetical protein GDO86_017466 [Hymenochirus boettgeri]|uniref:Partner and localiser of BRCA2 WD40 domain-containing protein n=1 Tax=Hymenochirus boettgeri TaxID=247094 RepID=A0A8T2IK54_9PIPI|nr:hypothetical protein GDO86_017466 [Hymenochirus boettgeri]